MICYKDMAFCVGPCANYSCDRHPCRVMPATNLDIPVAWMDFRQHCPLYVDPLPAGEKEKAPEGALRGE